MATVIGPLHSFEARGKVGSMVFGLWRGIQWVRQHFIPENPQTAKQINIRTAMALAVAEYQDQDAPEKALWDVLAKGKPISGYNLFMQAALDAYIDQLTIDVLPTTCAYTPPCPGSFVWGSA